MARRRKRQLVISAEVHPAPETPTQKQQLPVCEPLTLELAHFWFKSTHHSTSGMPPLTSEMDTSTSRMGTSTSEMPTST